MMSLEFERLLLETLLSSTIPGAAGGIVVFIFSLKKGHYRNNKYIAKFFIEVIGAMITATFLVTLIDDNLFKTVFSFMVGLAWAQIVHVLRNKITAIVEAALGEKGA